MDNRSIVLGGIVAGNGERPEKDEMCTEDCMGSRSFFWMLDKDPDITHKSPAER